MIRPHDSAIVRTLGHIVIPIAQLFGIYVLVFGQHGPGGGFVGGVIIAASMILAILIFGIDSPDSVLARKILHGDGLGLLIFAGVGGLCLIGGGQFLNYSYLQIPSLDEASQHYVGILLTQIGVAVDVAVTGVSIAVSLSFDENEIPNDEVSNV
ncbi:MAG: MnhB domain-containing protein [Gammaproteobacteria bacterium]|jgi:multicomponent Na+:H+ antiporter subunit B|tara:strand:- start:2297 stop:2758 length:462 start_codon:yes stop_codon:yes gene_type:complete